MNDRKPAAWKGFMLSAVAGVVLAGSPVGAQLADSVDGSVVRTDNHGVVTDKERARIGAAQNRASRHIAREKHDAQGARHR